MRLLIVDDSALMRRQLAKCFESEPDVEVALARDGEDALLKMREFQPDAITLDINMPKMDGLTCLAHIMEERPCPVIMVSSLTEKGAMATFEALELGAVDFIAKPDGTVSLSIDLVFDELRAKVRGVVNPSRRRTERPRVAPRPSVRERVTERLASSRPAAARPSRRSVIQQSGDCDLVLIGSSTGGPGTLGAILEALPADFPAPILVAQHMPPRFTRTYSQRLQETCDIRIEEVDRPTPLEAGTVYIACGGMDVAVTHQLRRIVARPVDPDPDRIWHPSVAHMVQTATSVLDPKRLIGVMLTGMGDDGAREMAQIHIEGGRTIAESEETAVVFGMPQQLIEQGGASLVLPFDKVAAQLLRWVGTQTAERTAACR